MHCLYGVMCDPVSWTVSSVFPHLFASCVVHMHVYLKKKHNIRCHRGDQVPQPLCISFGSGPLLFPDEGKEADGCVRAMKKCSQVLCNALALLLRTTLPFPWEIRQAPPLFNQTVGIEIW